MTLSKLLAAKIAELNLSASAAAEKMSVAYPSFTAVLKGSSLPNARTFKKYAKFLGIEVGEVEKLVGEAKGTKPKGAKPKGAKRKGPKSKGARRGRPPGSKNRVAAQGGSLVASLQAAVKLAGQAEAVLGDELAMLVHGLPKAQRHVIESVLSGLR